LLLSNLIRAIVVLALVSFCPTHVAADQISDLENRLTLLEKQIAVANKKKALLAIELELANAEKGIAAGMLKAAQDDYTAAVERLKLPIDTIKITGGQLSVIGKAQTCDPVPFLKWQCRREVKCNFTVDQAICGVPAGSGDPMLLSVSYRCGERTIEDEFAWGKPAQLVCE
jgi:hypothetical protein